MEWVCQECKEHKAVVHMTDIREGKKYERHLCLACAQKLGIAYPAAVSMATISELLSQVGSAEAGSAEEAPDVRCEVCGMTFAEFQKEGRFGCPNDYKAFKEQLNPLLERMHDTLVHIGKVPRHAGGDVKREAEVRALRERLQAAVDGEKYEEAARLRDEIARQIEGASSAGPPG